MAICHENLNSLGHSERYAVFEYDPNAARICPKFQNRNVSNDQNNFFDTLNCKYCSLPENYDIPFGINTWCWESQY